MLPSFLPLPETLNDWLPLPGHTCLWTAGLRTFPPHCQDERMLHECISGGHGAAERPLKPMQLMMVLRWAVSLAGHQQPEVALVCPPQYALCLLVQFSTQVRQTVLHPIPTPRVKCLLIGVMLPNLLSELLRRHLPMDGTLLTIQKASSRNVRSFPLGLPRQRDSLLTIATGTEW